MRQVVEVSPNDFVVFDYSEAETVIDGIEKQHGLYFLIVEDKIKVIDEYEVIRRVIAKLGRKDAVEVIEGDPDLKRCVRF